MWYDNDRCVNVISHLPGLLRHEQLRGSTPLEFRHACFPCPLDGRTVLVFAFYYYNGDLNPPSAYIVTEQLYQQALRSATYKNLEQPLDVAAELLSILQAEQDEEAGQCG